MQSSLYQSFKTFRSNEFGEIRTLEINNEPWFVGKDVAEVLGYANQNRDILRHIDEEDRIMVDGTQYQNGIEFDYKQIGQRGGWLINESGLYSLIIGSKLPSAKKFKRWVTSEVLPQIRRTGGYIPISQEDDEKTIMAKALMISQRTIEEKDALLAQKEKQVQYLSYEVESKDRYLNQIAQSKILF